MDESTNFSQNTRTSDSIAALAAALAAAQGEMKPAIKDSSNPFFKSKYSDLASCWDACRTALSRNELALIQMPIADGATVGVVTRLAHSSGEWMEATLRMESKDASPQAIGSAITYARRYALSAFVGIAPEDDDAEAAQGHEKKPMHQENLEHLSDPCQACKSAGVPDGWKTTPKAGHFYIRRASDRYTPEHNFEHKSHAYCPACLDLWNKESPQFRDSITAKFVKVSGAPVAGNGESKPASTSPAPQQGGAASQSPTVAAPQLPLTGPPEAIQKVTEAVKKMTQEKHDRPIGSKEKQELIRIATEAGWTDAGIRDALTKLNLRTLSDVTVGQFNEVKLYFQAGGKAPDVEVGGAA